MDEVRKLTERCDSLQSQITNIEEDRKRESDEALEKAKESLLSRKDFNFTLDKSTDESEGEEDAEDGSIPNFGKFESKKAKVLKKNLAGEAKFKEPRMFTMEQIRNIVFGVMNQSTMNDRVSLSEKRFIKIHNTCLRLDEIDKQIRHESQ